MLTFKDLKKTVSSATTAEEQHILFETLKDKPFWIWNVQQHKQLDIRTNGDCCFNHIIALPKKERDEKPIFDYQKLLYDNLLIPNINNPFHHDFKHKHLWVKKATGLYCLQIKLSMTTMIRTKIVRIMLKLELANVL